MKRPTLTQLSDGWSLRLRYGKGQRGRFFLPLESRAAAEKRAQGLAELATLLARSEKHDEAAIILRKGAAQTTDASFTEVERYTRELCAETKTTTVVVAPVTFRDLGEKWTSGKLARDFPDHVKVKRSVGDDVYRLAALYKTIGDVALKDFTLADAKRAMAAIPDGRTPATRRHYAQLIARLLKMAVFPCELIERYPLPPGFSPKTGPRPALSYLYPSEDARLLSCTLVPFELRLLFGFLAREGLRLGEAFALSWRHLDLERGTVRLEHTKSLDLGRAWALDPGTAKAMVAVREMRATEKADALVFPRPVDKPVELFRAYLMTAGVHRDELFERTPQRRPIRLHDQRACFATLSLAMGRSETWVMDRTGWTTSQMLNKYRRQSRNAAELGLGWLAPLNEALPELAPADEQEPCAPEQEVGHDMGHASSVLDLLDEETSSIPEAYMVGRQGLEPWTYGLKGRAETARDDETAEKQGVGATRSDTNEHRGPPENANLGQSVDPGAVERELAQALAGAVSAGRWELASRLMAELERRAGAHGSAGVVDLAAERSKRGKP